MIARIFDPAKSFHRVCRYLCLDQERSQVLEQEGVRGYDYRLMARDFEVMHSLRPGRETPVFHAVLDFHPAERIDDRRMLTIAREYLAEMGMTNTQYAFVKHIDKAHLHVHIVANKISYEGKHLQCYPERLISKDAVQKLIGKYQLIPAGQKKDLRHTNMEALDNQTASQYKIYRHILESLPGCKNLDELEARLLQRGVDTQYRYNEETGERQGISFRIEKEAFKGSRIDREFSFSRLQKTLTQQLDLGEWEKQKLAQHKKQQNELDQRALKEEQKKHHQKLEQAPKQTLQQKLRPQHRQPGDDDQIFTHKHSHSLGGLY